MECFIKVFIYGSIPDGHCDGQKNFIQLIQEMKKNPGSWLLWSFVGFGLFYAPLTFAAAYSPGWLIAGTWQITIISGALLAPLFYETIQTHHGVIQARAKIPFKGLSMSLIILLGIILMQLEHTSQIPLKVTLMGVVPVLIASFAYPLGNRKMMEVTNGSLDAYQRVLGNDACKSAILDYSVIIWAVYRRTANFESKYTVTPGSN